MDIFYLQVWFRPPSGYKELEKYIEANKAVSIRTIDFIEAIHPKIVGAIYWGHRTYFQHIKGKKDKDYKIKTGLEILHQNFLISKTL